MTHITIVVNRGLVEDVYSDSKDVVVDVIDLDSDNDSDYEAAQKALYETKQNMQRVL